MGDDTSHYSDGEGCGVTRWPLNRRAQVQTNPSEPRPLGSGGAPARRSPRSLTVAARKDLFGIRARRFNEKLPLRIRTRAGAEPQTAIWAKGEGEGRGLLGVGRLLRHRLGVGQVRQTRAEAAGCRTFQVGQGDDLPVDERVVIRPGRGRENPGVDHFLRTHLEIAAILVVKVLGGPVAGFRRFPRFLGLPVRLLPNAGTHLPLRGRSSRESPRRRPAPGTAATGHA